MRIRTGAVIRCLMVLLVATACGGGPSTVATTAPPPAPILDDHYGFIVGNSVRLESDAKALFVLNIPSDTAGVVSPDGRHLAYLANNELRVIDIVSGAQPRTLFAISAKEGAIYLAWSSDSTGLVVGVNGPLAPVNEGLPAYTKLRVVDAAGGTPRDVITIPGAAVVPLAWDRQAHLISAYESTQGGAGSYDVVSESARSSERIRGMGCSFCSPTKMASTCSVTETPTTLCVSGPWTRTSVESSSRRPAMST